MLVTGSSLYISVYILGKFSKQFLSGMKFSHSWLVPEDVIFRGFKGIAIEVFKELYRY